MLGLGNVPDTRLPEKHTVDTRARCRTGSLTPFSTSAVSWQADTDGLVTSF